MATVRRILARLFGRKRGRAKQDASIYPMF